MKKFLYIAILIAVFSTPVFSFAQGTPLVQNGGGTVTGGTTTIVSNSGVCTVPVKPTLQTLISYVLCLLTRSVVPLIFSLAIVMFIWGVVQYVIGAQEEAQREKGRMFMIWGIVALTVMVSVWGLVSIVGKTFGVQDGQGGNNFIPQLQDR